MNGNGCGRSLFGRTFESLSLFPNRSVTPIPVSKDIYSIKFSFFLVIFHYLLLRFVPIFFFHFCHYGCVDLTIVFSSFPGLIMLGLSYLVSVQMMLMSTSQHRLTVCVYVKSFYNLI